MKTTALGTSFEVRAPEGSEEVKVWLRYGKVVVTRERDSMYLKPGDALGYAGASRTVTPATPEAYRSGVLYFNRAGMEEVMTKLKNYYNIHITADSALYDRKWQVTGNSPKKTANSLSATSPTSPTCTTGCLAIPSGSCRRP